MLATMKRNFFIISLAISLFFAGSCLFAQIGMNSDDVQPGTFYETVINGKSQVEHTELFLYGPTNPSLKGKGDVLLFDNGPFVTHPGGGVGGADVSLVENPSTSYGSNMNLTAGYRMANDFTATADLSVNSLVFYGYQTNSALTSTFTGSRLQRVKTTSPFPVNPMASTLTVLLPKAEQR
jgi:hypothetical protein